MKQLFIRLGEIDRRYIFILISFSVLIPLIKPDWVNIPIKTTNNTEIVFKERRKWDTKPRLLASIEKAEKLIKYKPIIDFEEGFNSNIKNIR